MDKHVAIIGATQLSQVNPSLRDPVEYRKSGETGVRFHFPMNHQNRGQSALSSVKEP